MGGCCTATLPVLLGFIAKLFHPVMAQNKFKSLLEAVNYCDDFPLPQKDLKTYTAQMNSLYHFRVGQDPTTLGYVLPEIATKFNKCVGWVVNDKTTPKALILSGGNDYDSRTEIVSNTMVEFKNKRTFAVLEKWRGELKPCYGSTGEVIFAIERAAVPLLGVVAYGVMLIAYTRDEGGVTGLWVQRRSREAATHAGFLDGTAAGGVPIHKTPFTAMTNEAYEEASFSRELMVHRARTCGTLSYFHTRRREMGGEAGLLQPGVHFLYEMEVSQDVEPRSNDRDVDGFELVSTDKVRGEILAGNVKPWFALALIDFFIRHGITHEENERDFVEISVRLHRCLEFPVFGVSFLMNNLN